MRITSLGMDDADHHPLVDVLDGSLAEYADVLAESMVIYGPLLDRALVEYADHFPGGRP